MLTPLLTALAASFPTAPLAGPVPSDFATTVVSYTPGGGGGIFDPSNILGGPQGGGLSSGSLDVTTLGFGGEIVVGFDVTVGDGPGADFIVFENGFVVSGNNSVFAEVARVAVSTDGIAFAEFPSFVTPGTTQMGAYRGLAGGMPVLANVATVAIDPLDPVVAGGDAFDLADLTGTPEVLSGTVDLSSIHFVRLRDVQSGELDSVGTVISDAGSADFDAISVVQHAGTQSLSGPIVDLAFDAQGHLVWTIGDPDGIGDLNLATLSASFNLAPIPVTVLLNALDFVSFDGNTLVLRSAIPLDDPNSGLIGALSVSTRDFAGSFSADQAML